MAKILPENFPPSVDNLLLNVDYFDFAAGAGYKTFYPVILKDSGGNEYALVDNTNIGADQNNNVFFVGVDGNSDYDFDIKFLNPVTVAAANCFVDLSILIVPPTTKTIDVIAYIKHYDGTTETTIGTITFPQRQNASGNTDYMRLSAKTQLTRKRFAIGDTLRLTLDITNNAANQGVYCDPTGRVTHTEYLTGATISTTTKVLIPFEVKD